MVGINSQWCVTGLESGDHLLKIAKQDGEGQVSINLCQDAIR